MLRSQPVEHSGAPPVDRSVVAGSHPRRRAAGDERVGNAAEPEHAPVRSDEDAAGEQAIDLTVTQAGRVKLGSRNDSVALGGHLAGFGCGVHAWRLPQG